jgi:hypothetical protein
MSFKWSGAGPNMVGEYQVSGHNFILANGTSARTVVLEFISNEITIIANEDAATITFEDGGANTRTVTLPKGSHTFRIKCKKFVTNNKSISVIVSCTNIKAHEYTAPTFAVLGTIS